MSSESFFYFKTTTLYTSNKHLTSIIYMHNGVSATSVCNIMLDGVM